MADLRALVILAACAFSGACIAGDRKSTRLNSSHLVISYAVFCLQKTRDPRNTALDPSLPHHPPAGRAQNVDLACPHEPVSELPIPKRPETCLRSDGHLPRHLRAT